MVLFSEIESHVIDKLKNGLSPTLTYHNVEHTLDVLKQAVTIAKEEGINEENDLLILKIGALYHDIGFLDTYEDHEERSCEIAAVELPAFGLRKEKIDKICGIIRATRIPQAPSTILEQIICDADLDYLGRPDFLPIAEGLYHEFLIHKIVSDDKSWNLLQVRFFMNHNYFTQSSKQKRQGLKDVHLKALRKLIVDY